MEFRSRTRVIARVVIKELWKPFLVFLMMLALYGWVIGVSALATWLWGPVS